MLNFILPFIILIIVVVFIHEYGHYYFAKKYGVGVPIFQLVLVKNYLDGMINQELDGKYVGYHLVVMLNFSVIEMFLAKLIKKKYLASIMKKTKTSYLLLNHYIKDRL